MHNCRRIILNRLNGYLKNVPRAIGHMEPLHGRLVWLSYYSILESCIGIYENEYGGEASGIGVVSIIEPVNGKTVVLERKHIVGTVCIL
jgi:hypothetical protein